MKIATLQLNIGKRFRFDFRKPDGSLFTRTGVLVRMLRPKEALSLREARALCLDLSGKGKDYLNRPTTVHRAILTHSEGWTGVPEPWFKDLTPIDQLSTNL
jgi:hypothetical protein